MLNINNQEDGSVGVFPENFVDLKIMGLERLAGGVPPYELLFLTDLNRIYVTFLIMSNIASWYKWSKNQMLG